MLRSRKATTALCDDRFSSIARWWLEGKCRECVQIEIAFHARVERGLVGQHARMEIEVGCGDLCIGVTDAKRDERADVAEDGARDFGFQLIEELICERDLQSVLAGFGEELRERERREGLELIDVEGDGSSFVVMLFCARHDCVADY